MNENDLRKLNVAVELLLRQKIFLQTIRELKEAVRHSEEPFVWSVITLLPIDCELPENIRSCWIFVLKKDVSSGCHYHPNSIQHMVMLAGRGKSKVADLWKKMVPFGSSGYSLTDAWYVIGQGIPHEFFPEEEDMVVVSFHTCAADELEEIACETGEKRFYQGQIERLLSEHCQNEKF